MKDAIKEITSKQIKGEASVRSFLHACIVTFQLGMGFHPDNSFEDYIYKSGSDEDDRVFTDEEAQELNKVLDACFEECQNLKLDIYSIGLEIMDPILKEAFDKK